MENRTELFVINNIFYPCGSEHQFCRRRIRHNKRTASKDKLCMHNAAYKIWKCTMDLFHWLPGLHCGQCASVLLGAGNEDCNSISVVDPVILCFFSSTCLEFFHRELEHQCAKKKTKKNHPQNSKVVQVLQIERCLWQHKKCIKAHGCYSGSN